MKPNGSEKVGESTKFDAQSAPVYGTGAGAGAGAGVGVDVGVLESKGDEASSSRASRVADVRRGQAKDGQVSVVVKSGSDKGVSATVCPGVSQGLKKNPGLFGFLGVALPGLSALGVAYSLKALGPVAAWFHPGTSSSPVFLAGGMAFGALVESYAAWKSRQHKKRKGAGFFLSPCGSWKIGHFNYARVAVFVALVTQGLAHVHSIAAHISDPKFLKAEPNISAALYLGAGILMAAGLFAQYWNIKKAPAGSRNFVAPPSETGLGDRHSDSGGSGATFAHDPATGRIAWKMKEGAVSGSAKVVGGVDSYHVLSGEMPSSDSKLSEQAPGVASRPPLRVLDRHAMAQTGSSGGVAVVAGNSALAIAPGVPSAPPADLRATSVRGGKHRSHRRRGLESSAGSGVSETPSGPE